MCWRTRRGERALDDGGSWAGRSGPRGSRGVWEGTRISPQSLDAPWELGALIAGVGMGLVVQFSSVTQSCPTLCDPMDCSTPGLPVDHQLPEFTQLMSIESVMPSNHLILCHPLLLPSIFPSIKVFSNESALHIRWPKYWSFSFSIIPSKEHPGLISFRMDWLDLLEVQGTLKSVLKHHSSKTQFFCTQLSLSSIAPLFLLPSIFPSIKVFSNESVLPIRWPKY